VVSLLAIVLAPASSHGEQATGVGAG